MKLFGKRILISGSATNKSELGYAHALVQSMVAFFLENHAGFTVSIGKEPLLEGSARIFDWTILEAVAEYHRKNQLIPNHNLGTYVVAFGLRNWQTNLPPNRISLWTYLVENNLVEVIQIKDSLSFGGKFRELQASNADLLMTLGGDRGVHHLIDLFTQSHKPVIPLNLSLSEHMSSSEYHYKRFCENPNEYLETTPSFNLVAHCSLINLNYHPLPRQFIEYLANIIAEILPPRAFFIRLMNPKHEDYEDVQLYFRKIVDPVLEKLEYRRFEAGIDLNDEPFMNIEIFSNLHFSSLAFVDVTGLRNNCFLELGYALGQQKKYILSAKRCTDLPFDTEMIYCHFWDLSNGVSNEKKRLESFIRQHINKNPLVSN